MTSIDLVTLAGAFENIGNGLFALGDGWADKALKTVLGIVVVVAVIKKMSLKAAIGGVLGLAICLGIYHSRTDLSEAVKQEIVDLQSAPAPGLHAPGRGETTGWTA